MSQCTLLLFNLLIVHYAKNLLDWKDNKLFSAHILQRSSAGIMIFSFYLVLAQLLEMETEVWIALLYNYKGDAAV